MALTKAKNRMIDGAAVNVKDFGVTGDGVTDDTVAFQAALDSFDSYGGTLFVPHNDNSVGYRIEGTLIWPNNGTICYPIDLVGEQVTNQFQLICTCIRFIGVTNTGFDLRNGDDSNLRFNGSFRNIYIRGPGDPAVDVSVTAIGIHAYDMKQTVMENVQLIHWYSGMVVANSVLYAKFENVDIANVHHGFNGGTYCLVNGVTFNKWRVTDCAGTGIWINGGGNVNITDCIIEHCDASGIVCKNIVSLYLTGCYFEDMTPNGVYVYTDQQGYYNTSVTALGNNFNAETTNPSMKLDTVLNVALIGNKFTATNGTSAIDIVGPQPHGIITGNEGPRDGSPIMASEDAASVTFGDALNPHVGFSGSFPDNQQGLIKGSLYLNDDADKGIFGWTVTESGAGLAATPIPATTCTTSAASKTVTTLSQYSQLYVGITIQIAGETFGASGDDYATVMYMTTTTLVLDKAAVTGVTGAALTANAVAKTNLLNVPYSRSHHGTSSTAGTGEDDLQTTTLPANYLFDSDGYWLGGFKVIAAGTKTNSNGNKTIKFHFGSTEIVFHVAANNTNDWRFEAMVSARVTSNAQGISWKGYDGTTLTQGYEETTEDGTAAIIVKVTGECAHASDTISQKNWHIESF